MVFIRGYAEELPFLDGSFDIVFFRLAFHHFTDPEKCFSEMVRCLRTGGRLVMIDMEAAREDLRLSQDTIETLRDPSHVRNLSRSEMLSLFSDHGLRVEKCETTKIRQELTSWMALILEQGRVRDWLLNDKATDSILEQTPVMLDQYTEYEQLTFFDL